MTQTISLEIEVPGDLGKFRLPQALRAKLQSLLDRQDTGTPLTPTERDEAEALVDMGELLSLLKLRSERLHEDGEDGAVP